MTSGPQLTNIERLTLADEIRELMARYVRYADEKRWDALAQLFTPDGSFTPLDVAGKPLAQMEGREAIARVIDASVGNATAIHHLFSYEIALESSSRATGIFAMEDLVVKPDGAEVAPASDSGVPAFRKLHGYGHYRATFAKASGEWAIAKLTLTRTKLDLT